MKNKLTSFAPILILGLLTLIFFWKILLTNLILVGVDVYLYFYPYKAYAAEALRAGRFPLWNPHIFMGVPFLANSQVGLLYPFNWLFLWASPPRQVAYSIGLHIWLAGVGAYFFAYVGLKLSRLAALTAGIIFALGGFLGAQVEHLNQLQVSALMPWLFLVFELLAQTIIQKASARKIALYIALLAVIITLMLLAGHTQSVYITLFGLGIYGFFRLGMPWGKPKAIGVHLLKTALLLLPLIAASLLALLASSAQLLPTLELAQLSIRSGGLDYFEAVSFSLNPLKLPYTLLPPYGVDLEAALGQAFSEFVAYVGLVSLGLALWGGIHLLKSKQTERWSLGLTGATGLVLAFGVFSGPIYLALYFLVPGFNLFRVPARWLLLYAFCVAMLAGIGFDLIKKKRYQYILFGLIVIELFAGSQALRYNQPTAPEAYSFLRPAIAQLQVAQTPTDRFLSLSGISYDPGDLKEIYNIFGDQLSERAIYDYIITVKEKEVLFFNLPMVFGLNAIDGYDGGLLPLKSFIDFERLFLDEDNLSLDGRLREKLTAVPPARLLSLVGVRHIITDKVYDVWLDNIFYDLQFPARLNPHTTPEVWTENIPPFQAGAVGVIFNTPQTQTPAGTLIIRYANGQEVEFPLIAGEGKPWPNDEFGLDYNQVFPLPAYESNNPIQAIGLKATDNLTVRGISLIEPVSTTSRSVLLTAAGNYKTIHGGDVKIYENPDILPRAFVVHQMEIVSDTKTAISHLKDPAVDLSTQIVRLANKGETPAQQTLGSAGPDDKVEIIHYAPEQIEININLAQPGWLVLTDTYYPGWTARIDGEETGITEVNLILRAIEVPAGAHTITFQYQPRSFKTGIWLSLIGLTLILSLIIVALRRKAPSRVHFSL